MDKFIYVAVGLSVLLIAAVDQSNDPGQATPPVGLAVTAAAQSPAAAMGETRSSPYAEMAPSETNSALPSVNPIPRADALAGKVIDDRFQPDG